MSFCSCSALPQRLQPTRLRPLTRLEHEQKSGVISVYFILSEALSNASYAFLSCHPRAAARTPVIFESNNDSKKLIVKNRSTHVSMATVRSGTANRNRWEPIRYETHNRPWSTPLTGCGHRSRNGHGYSTDIGFPVLKAFPAGAPVMSN